MHRRKRKKLAIVILFLILIIFGTVLYFLLFKIKGYNNNTVAEIKDYDYTLEKRDTQLMQDIFYNLSETLKKDEIDYEKYAEYLSELFIVDLYTLDNKKTKYDVGGVEYIYPSHRDNYKLKVQDTLYNYLEEKSGRKQKLPIVSEIAVSSISVAEKYNMGEESYDAYKLDIKWDYVVDLGYDKVGSITLIKIDNKLFVAEFTPEVNE